MQTIPRRGAALGLLALCGILSLPLSATAQKANDDDKGRVDWNSGKIIATGLGAISLTEKNDAKAYLRARSFARMDARRNLLAVISHVKIDSHTVGQDYEATSDTIREEISGLVKGTEIVSERKIRIGNSWMVEVTATMPIYGEGGLASVLVPEIIKRQKARDIDPDMARERDAEPESQRNVEPKEGGFDTSEETTEKSTPQPERPIEPAPVVAPRELEPFSSVLTTQPLPGRTGYYTGVIIDTRGLGVERCMAPKIRSRSGRELWVGGRVDEDYIIAHGIVSYVHSMSEARQNPRAGKNPIVLKGTPCAGNRFNTDAGLSEEDARQLLELDSKSRFLDKCRVIFIVDAGK